MASDYEILTSEGFKNFEDVLVMGTSSTIIITLENGDWVECTPDHCVYSNGIWKEASSFQLGDIVTTQNGNVKVSNIDVNESIVDVYDIIEVEDTHHFYANNIMVHNCLMLDEFAFVPKNIADEFMTSVYPTISSGKTTKIIITSTPFGMNHFYKLWMDASEGRNSFKTIRVPWFKVPGRDEKWRDETLKNIGEEAFAQEYDIEFIGSAGTLIDPVVLKSLVYKEPISNDKNLKVYFEPVKHHTYVATVDCSEGLGQDYACMTVFDITSMPYQQVAVYRSNMVDPHILPDIIKEISEKYNNAKVLLELNSTGVLVTSMLWNDLEFEHMLWVSQMGSKGQVLGAYSGRAQMGLKTTVVTKKIGCSILKTLIENYQLIINDYTTIQELCSFARDGNTYKAQDGNNDDTVACLFIFAWMTKQAGFAMILEESYQLPEEHDLRHKIHTDALDAVNSMLLPLPVIDDGLDEDYEDRKRRFRVPDPFTFL